MSRQSRLNPNRMPYIGKLGCSGSRGISTFIAVAISVMLLASPIAVNAALCTNTTYAYYSNTLQNTVTFNYTIVGGGGGGGGGWSQADDAGTSGASGTEVTGNYAFASGNTLTIYVGGGGGGGSGATGCGSQGGSGGSGWYGGGGGGSDGGLCGGGGGGGSTVILSNNALVNYAAGGNGGESGGGNYGGGGGTNVGGQGYSDGGNGGYLYGGSTLWSGYNYGGSNGIGGGSGTDGGGGGGWGGGGGSGGNVDYEIGGSGGSFGSNGVTASGTDTGSGGIGSLYETSSQYGSGGAGGAQYVGGNGGNGGIVIFTWNQGAGNPLCLLSIATNFPVSLDFSAGNIIPQGVPDIANAMTSNTGDTVTINDCLGRCAPSSVLATGTTSVTYNLDNLQSGLYTMDACDTTTSICTPNSIVIIGVTLSFSNGNSTAQGTSDNAIGTTTTPGDAVAVEYCRGYSCSPSTVLASGTGNAIYNLDNLPSGIYTMDACDTTLNGCSATNTVTIGTVLSLSNGNSIAQGTSDDAIGAAGPPGDTVAVEYCQGLSCTPSFIPVEGTNIATYNLDNLPSGQYVFDACDLTQNNCSPTNTAIVGVSLNFSDGNSIVQGTSDRVTGFTGVTGDSVEINYCTGYSCSPSTVLASGTSSVTYNLDNFLPGRYTLDACDTTSSTCSENYTVSILANATTCTNVTTSYFSYTIPDTVEFNYAMYGGGGGGNGDSNENGSAGSGAIGTFSADVGNALAIYVGGGGGGAGWSCGSGGGGGGAGYYGGGGGSECYGGGGGSSAILINGNLVNYASGGAGYSNGCGGFGGSNAGGSGGGCGGGDNGNAGVGGNGGQWYLYVNDGGAGGNGRTGGSGGRGGQEGDGPGGGGGGYGGGGGGGGFYATAGAGGSNGGSGTSSYGSGGAGGSTGAGGFAGSGGAGGNVTLTWNQPLGNPLCLLTLANSETVALDFSAGNIIPQGVSDVANAVTINTGDTVTINYCSGRCTPSSVLATGTTTATYNLDNLQSGLYTMDACDTTQNVCSSNSTVVIGVTLSFSNGNSTAQGTPDNAIGTTTTPEDTVAVEYCLGYSCSPSTVLASGTGNAIYNLDNLPSGIYTMDACDTTLNGCSATNTVTIGTVLSFSNGNSIAQGTSDNATGVTGSLGDTVAVEYCQGLMCTPTNILATGTNSVTYNLDNLQSGVYVFDACDTILNSCSPTNTVIVGVSLNFSAGETIVQGTSDIVTGFTGTLGDAIEINYCSALSCTPSTTLSTGTNSTNYNIDSLQPGLYVFDACDTTSSTCSVYYGVLIKANATSCTNATTSYFSGTMPDTVPFSYTMYGGGGGGNYDYAGNTAQSSSGNFLVIAGQTVSIYVGGGGGGASSSSGGGGGGGGSGYYGGGGGGANGYPAGGGGGGSSAILVNGSVIAYADGGGGATYIGGGNEDGYGGGGGTSTAGGAGGEGSSGNGFSGGAQFGGNGSGGGWTAGLGGSAGTGGASGSGCAGGGGGGYGGGGGAGSACDGGGGGGSNGADGANVTPYGSFGGTGDSDGAGGSAGYGGGISLPGAGGGNGGSVILTWNQGNGNPLCLLSLASSVSVTLNFSAGNIIPQGVSDIANAMTSNTGDTVTINDCLGRCAPSSVLATGTNSVTYNLDNLQSGLYTMNACDTTQNVCSSNTTVIIGVTLSFSNGNSIVRETSDNAIGTTMTPGDTVAVEYCSGYSCSPSNVLASGTGNAIYNLDNLPSGIYTMDACDTTFNGCSLTNTVIIAPSQLIATPNPFSFTKTIIKVGQTSEASTVISNGVSPYNGSWSWSMANVVAGNTTTAYLPSNNTLSLTINAVSSTEVQLTFNGTTYDVYANTTPTFNVIHSFGGDIGTGCNPLGSLLRSGDTLYGMTLECGSSEGAGAIFSINITTGSLNVLHVFDSILDSYAANPIGSLTISNNTLYGTTNDGGQDGYGIIFSMNVNGSDFTVLHNFTDNSNDGASPVGTLALDNGSLYGMTSNGGSNDDGVIFSIHANGTDFSVIYNFTGGSSGEEPAGSVSLVSSGDVLYGALQDGGQYGCSCGYIFSLNTSGANFSTLYSFNDVGTEGYHPYGALILSGSTLYGTTESGGSGGYGTVFSIKTDGSRFTTINSLNYINGSQPNGQLTLIGNTLYGMTGSGGADNAGTVFMLNANEGGLVDLHNFGTASYDGQSPIYGNVTIINNTLYGMTVGGGYYDDGVIFSLNLTQTTDTGANPISSLTLSGNTLYGTTVNGGADNYGTIFSFNTLSDITTIRHSFTGGPDGVYPQVSSFTISGNLLYSTTYAGGAHGYGTIFSFNTHSNTVSILHSFSGTLSDGANPLGSLILSGNTLYGTTLYGGSEGFGTIFSFNTRSNTIVILHSFTGYSSDGAYPSGNLTMSRNILYGTTENGGSSNYGTIFSFNIISKTITILHNFTGGSYDGAYPEGNLTISGNTLYGATGEGGSSNDGTIFSFNIISNTITILYNFTGSPDGSYPLSPLILSGNTLYGTTGVGGSSNDGTIFSFNTLSNTITILHSFSSSSSDGFYPESSLTLSGNTLYGTTLGGGLSGEGTIFSISTRGTDFKVLQSFGGGYSTIYNFSDNYVSDGAHPFASVTVSGNTLYGTTVAGGSDNEGAVFSINKDGSGLSILHNFTGPSSDGENPRGSLTLSNNTLYGMTQYGGSDNYGTVFSLDINGSDFDILHSFTDSAGDGAYPNGTLLLIGHTLYGMTTAGGSSNYGTIFSMTTGGAFTLLHSFTGNAGDGESPFGSLINSGTTLYGMTYAGGADGYGEIFSIKTSGNGFSVIHSFTGNITTGDGAQPLGSLTLYNNTLYGTTSEGGNYSEGTIFSVKTDGDNFSTIYNFTGGNDGAQPLGSLTLYNNTLYGMTNRGGAWGCGVVFSENLSDLNFSVLHGFVNGCDTDGSDGGYPEYGNLTVSDGILYGMASYGGTYDGGTLFSENPTSGGTIYGTWTFNGTASDVLGDLDPVPQLNNTLIIIPTTTVPQNQGHGSGGSGGGGSGGSAGSGAGGGGQYLPGVTISNSCAQIVNFTQLDKVAFSLDGQQFNIVENYITPTSAGITINGDSYTIGNGNGIYLETNSSFTATLKGISYLPIIQTITLELCGPSITAATTTIAPTTTAANVSNGKSVTFSIDNINITVNTNITSQHSTQVSLDNVTTSTPPAPANFTKLFAFNVTATNSTSLTILLHYNCSYANPRPFELVNNSWHAISVYTRNSAACTITFTIPSDPVFAIFNPVSSTGATSTVPATSAISTIIATHLSNLPTYVYAVIIIVVVVVLVALYLRLRRRKKW